MLDDRVDFFRPCLQFFSHVGTFSWDEPVVCFKVAKFVQEHNTGPDLGTKLFGTLLVRLKVFFSQTVIWKKMIQTL